jgi:hypothetical protein
MSLRRTVSSRTRTAGLQSQYFRRVSLLSRRCDLITFVVPPATKRHAGQPLQARIVRKASRTARRTAQIQPMQRRPAARLEVGL